MQIVSVVSAIDEHVDCSFPSLRNGAAVVVPLTQIEGIAIGVESRSSSVMVFGADTPGALAIVVDIFHRHRRREAP